MKIVVLSDIHGRYDRAETVLKMHSDADTVFFLGDGIADISTCQRLIDGKAFAGVKGNCDFFTKSSDYNYTDELFLDLGAYTVMLMHGHLRSVKSDIDKALKHAAQKGADILLYGHTHVAAEKYFPSGYDADGYILQKPVWTMNPGSLGEPRGGAPSYGLIQVRKGQLLLSFGEV